MSTEIVEIDDMVKALAVGGRERQSATMLVDPAIC